MTPQQMIEFDARREAVLRHQLKTNPKFRAMRRDRRVAFAAGVVRYAVSVAIALFLMKAFVISQAGGAGYQAMVAPVVAQLPEGGLLAQAFAPDMYSNRLAAMFASLVTDDVPGSESAVTQIERLGPVAPEG